MAVSKVTILDGCISCALCEQICPEVFEIPDIARVKSGVDLNQFEEKSGGRRFVSGDRDQSRIGKLKGHAPTPT